MKTCSKCKEQKGLEYFHKDKYKKDGLSVKCKECVKEYKKTYKPLYTKRKKIIINDLSKQCSKCMAIQRNSKFHKDRCGKGGLQSVCILCNKQRRQDNIERVLNSGKMYRHKVKNKKKTIPEFKVCGKCSLLKKNDMFSFSSFRNDGLKWACKKCLNNLTEKQKSKKQKTHNRWASKNIEKVRKYRNKWFKKRRDSDLSFRLRCTISASVGTMLRNNCSMKNGSTLKYLPYTIEELRAHLESQFEGWMSWENYGSYKIGGPKKWHIDHIIPQSKLPYDSMGHTNFLKCWDLNNLRPLDAILNIKKGNKICQR